MNFHVGQKVVYVGGGPKLSDNWGPKWSVKIGDILTVREIDPLYIEYRGCVGLRFFEHYHEPLRWMGGITEPAILAFRVRPVIERKTDIGMAILRKIADDASKRIPVKA